MADLVLDSFVGYQPDVASPDPNSARSTKNAVIHLHRKENSPGGWIELAPGYAKKYAALPANDTVIRKISNIVFDKPYDLYIPEHGGRVVTVLTATYRKTGFFPGAPTLDTAGVWIRPYWSGSAWISTDWRELTEFFIFDALDLGTGADDDKIYIDDLTTYSFQTLDPTSIVFDTDSFKNWVIVYDSFGDAENYDLVSSSGFDANGYFLQLLPGHKNTDYTTRPAGTKLLVFRNFFLQNLPSTLQSHIYGLLSEARITTGQRSTDLSILVAHREADTQAAGAFTGGYYLRHIDAVLAEPATLNFWRYVVAISLGPTYTATGDEILPPGTYTLKASLVLDDGNEMIAYDAVTADLSSSAPWASGNTVTIAAGEEKKINIYAFRSWGALPARARYLRVYMSDDGVEFYRVKDIDLRDPDYTNVWMDSGLFGAAVIGGNHWYAVAGHGPTTNTNIYITGVDWANAGALNQIQRGGMGIADSGLVQFKHAAAVGRTVMAVGVRALGTLYPNYVFTSPSNADGQPAFDTFPLLPALMIDLEYNDGDELVAIAPLTDRALALKRSSLVLVGFSNGVYTRDIVTSSDGICSAEAVAVFDDVVYWPGYAGIYRYSTRGWDLINKAFWDEWLAVSVADKEAAVGVIDRLNRQYRLAYAGIERILDIDTGQWICADLADQPAQFTRNTREGKVDFLSGSYLQTLGAGTLHDGANFTMEYETNDVEAAPGPGKNALLTALQLRYNSSVALSVQLYGDGVAIGSAVTLPASAVDTDQIVEAPMSTRCKRFRLKISATTTAASQTVQVKHIKPVYELMDSGVSDAN